MNLTIYFLVHPINHHLCLDHLLQLLLLKNYPDYSRCDLLMLFALLCRGVSKNVKFPMGRGRFLVNFFLEKRGYGPLVFDYTELIVMVKYPAFDEPLAEMDIHFSDRDD